MDFTAAYSKLATHILGKMTRLIALAALDTLSRTGLGTVLGVVALLFTVLTGVGIDALLVTVASTMAGSLAVDTLGLGLGVFALNLFLLAVLLKD